MKLTLTGLSSQYIHMPLAPVCLRRAVEEAEPRCEVTVCDININETQDTILERVLADEPDVLGVCMYIWNRECACRLIRRVKAVRPETIVIAGGPEATWSVERCFDEMPLDYLLRGAGEESLPMLLGCLIDGAPLDDVPGLCLVREGRLLVREPAIAPPPRADLYDGRWQTELQGRMAYVETSRGCPFSCAFCLSGQRERVQLMPQEEALGLLVRLGGSGAETVKLIDRTFNCVRERTTFLLRGLMDAKERGEIGRVCYHLEVAADLFDEEQLTLLSRAPAGLFQMEAGLQSFHGETLEACSRHTDMARLESNLRRILAPGNVHLHIDLIAGLPREDFETFGRSFDRAYRLKPHQLQLGFLKLIHGSRLRMTDWGQRFAPDPPYEVLSTPWLSYGDVCKLRACAEALERIGNSGRFADTLRLTLQSVDIRPFELFMHLGRAMAARQGRWSLDHLTEMVYRELLTLGVAQEALRDAMVSDRLATDRTGCLPPVLQGDAETLRRAVKRWRDAHPEERHPRCALLSGGRLLVACWEEKHPVTQRGETAVYPAMQG